MHVSIFVVFSAMCTCKIRVFTSASCPRGYGRLLITAVRSRSISTSSVVLLTSPPPQTEQVQRAEVERHAHPLPPHLKSPRVREAVATALDDDKVQWKYCWLTIHSSLITSCKMSELFYQQQTSLPLQRRPGERCVYIPLSYPVSISSSQNID